MDDFKKISDLLWDMNFCIHRLEKITFFEKPEWEQHTKNMDTGYRLIQQANNKLSELFNQALQAEKEGGE